MASAQGAGPQKTMSSRLMNMKFMKKAAATAPPPSPNTITETEKPNKRQKISHLPSRSRDEEESKLVVDTGADEDTRRREALKRLAEDSGDTFWTLPSESQPEPPDHPYTLQVLQAGYGQIDAPGVHGIVGDGDDDDVQDPGGALEHIMGRRSFGDFGKDKQKRQREQTSNDEEGSDEGSDSSSAQSSESLKHRKKRTRKPDGNDGTKDVYYTPKNVQKDNQVKLSRLTSISGGGASKNSQGSAVKDMQCFKCGKKGHRKADCPLLQRQSRRRD